jgi:UDP-N-acetylglucosamine diphosphorylase/glucosamine-1-phosphate N-acetyltransferase
MDSNLGVVILAAGLGTRMKSDKAKVLHEICGRPMIDYVMQTAMEVAGQNIVVVIGHQAEKVKKTVKKVGEAHFALQEKQLGTGHAVLCALPIIPAPVEQVIILCGDVPLIRPETIKALAADHNHHQRDLTLLAVSLDEPKGYGRIIFDGEGGLTAIIEEKDASPSEKLINTINTGIYIVNRKFLELSLPQLRSDNAQNEIYLTDIIGIGYRQKSKIGVVIGRDSQEIIGVNSRDDLKTAEDRMKQRQGEIA